MHRPLVLDFDASLTELVEAESISLGGWQDAIRFGCGKSTWRALKAKLNECLPRRYGTVFTGSGDFHHLSHLLIERIPCGNPIDVVVCDNHPDNMLFPWGIHCGSWIQHTALLPMVRTIHVIGITSTDVGWGHAFENYLAPLYRGRLHYWTIGVNTSWSNLLGLASSVHSFPTPEALLECFLREINTDSAPVYLSIDKDVLSSQVAQTNWDQGCFMLKHLEELITMLGGRLIGSDISGEVSIHRYRSRWKRWLTAIDNQPEVSSANLVRWQQQQIEINRRLLDHINSAQRFR